jgi:hypothetical protein
MLDLIAGGPCDSGRRLDVPCPLCRLGHHLLALTAGNHNFAFRCSGKRLLGGYGFGEPTNREPMEASIIEDDRGSETC